MFGQGHPILTPDGSEIRIPNHAFLKIRRLGALGKNRENGLPQITDQIYLFLNPEFDSLSNGLRQLLGSDCSGPQEVLCNCKECRELKELDQKEPPPPRPTRENKFQPYAKTA